MPCRVTQYLDTCLEFASLVPSLTNRDLDPEGKLQEQTLLVSLAEYRHE